MGTVADKLTYLNTTKGKLKDVINMTAANIDNQTTFRNYAQALYDGYINVLKDRDTLLDNVPKSTSTGSISEGLGLPIYEDKMSKLSTQETTRGYNLAYTGWAQNFVQRVNDTSKANIVDYDSHNSLYYSPNVSYGDNDNKYIFKIDWKQNTAYTFSIDILNTSSNSSNLEIVYTDNSVEYFGGTPTPNTWHHVSKTSNANKTIKYLISAYYSGNRYLDLDSFMVVEGTETLPYEPYTYGASPNPDYPQEVKTVKGYRNLLENINSTSEISGVKITKNNDGSLYLKGKATANIYYYLQGTGSVYPFSLNAGTYTLSGGISSGVFIRLANASINKDSLGTANTFTLDETTSFYCLLRITTNTEVDTTIYPMIVEGNQQLPYIPYGTNWIYTTISIGNLYDKNNIISGDYLNSAGTLVESDFWSISNYIKVNPNETVYYNGLTNVGNAPYSAYYDENKNFISSFKQATDSQEFNIPNNVYYIRFSIFKDDVDSFVVNQKKEIPIPLNDNEICGIGDYKDEIIVNKQGHCYLNKKIGKVILNGTEDYDFNTNSNLNTTDYNCFYVAGHLGCIQASNQTDILTLCNKLKGTGSTNRTTNMLNIWLSHLGADQLYFHLPNTLTTSNEVKTWLTTNNLIVYYVLATPILTDLNYNADMTLYSGINNITNSENMDMSIKYIKDTYE